MSQYISERKHLSKKKVPYTSPAIDCQSPVSQQLRHNRETVKNRDNCDTVVTEGVLDQSGILGYWYFFWDIGILPLGNWDIGISMRNLGYWDIGHEEFGIEFGILGCWSFEFGILVL